MLHLKCSNFQADYLNSREWQYFRLDSAFDKQELAEKMVKEIDEYKKIKSKISDERYNSSLIYYKACYELLDWVSKVEAGFIDAGKLNENAIRSSINKAIPNCGETPDLLYHIAKELSIMFVNVNELITARFFTRIAKFCYQAIASNKYSSKLFGKCPLSEQPIEKVTFNNYMWELEYLEKMIIKSAKMKRKQIDFQERNDFQKIHNLIGQGNNGISIISNLSTAERIASNVFTLVEKAHKLCEQAKLTDADQHELNIQSYKGLAYVNIFEFFRNYG